MPLVALMTVLLYRILSGSIGRPNRLYCAILLYSLVHGFNRSCRWIAGHILEYRRGFGLSRVTALGLAELPQLAPATAVMLRQAEAQRQRLGLWADPDAVAP